MKIRKHRFSWESDESQMIFLKYHRSDAEQARLEVEKIIKYLSLKPPGEVLDVGCGLGLHLRAFEHYGFSGIGIDVSDYIIKEAVSNCTNSSHCKIIKMRGSEINWENRFDLVYSLALLLGFMDEHELQMHIKNMWNAVRKGGGLFMGVPYILEPDGDFKPVNKWELADGVYTLTDKRIDDNNIKREHCVIIDPESNQIDEWFEEQRYYPENEIVELLKECGLEASKALLNFYGDTVNNSSHAKLFFARKGKT